MEVIMTAIQQTQVTAMLIVIFLFSFSTLDWMFLFFLFMFRAVKSTGAFLKAGTTNPSRDDALGDGPLGCPNDIPDPDLDENLGLWSWQHSTPYVSLFKPEDIGTGKIPVRNNKFFINGTEEDDEMNSITTMLEDVTLQNDRDSSCSTPSASAPIRNKFYFNGVDGNNNSNVRVPSKTTQSTLVKSGRRFSAYLNDADDTTIVHSSTPAAPVDKYCRRPLWTYNNTNVETAQSTLLKYGRRFSDYLKDASFVDSFTPAAPVDTYCRRPLWTYQPRAPEPLHPFCRRPLSEYGAKLH